MLNHFKAYSIKTDPNHTKAVKGKEPYTLQWTGRPRSALFCVSIPKHKFIIYF